MLSEPVRDDLIKRLRRIEGQTKGIQRMLLEGRECREILTQLTSVRSATQSLSAELLRHHIRGCLEDGTCGGSQQGLDELITLLLRA